MSMLCYRFPNEEIVRQTGYFDLLSDENVTYQGFIVSNFTQSLRYGFTVSSKLTEQFHFTDEEIVQIDQSEYFRGTKTLLQLMQMIPLQKTVLTRIKCVDFDESNTEALFSALLETYPNALVYLISDPILGTWLGASPELLLRSVGEQGFSVSLAGTKKSSDITPWTKKEQNEQEIVSQFIGQQLTELGSHSIEMIGPYDYEAGPVKHLRADFSFRTKLDEMSILKSLHPTPAVSGMPRTLSLEVIENIEEHERSIYTGYLGILKDGDTKIYVNLRCCQIQRGKMYLYLGGGFTPDSIPELEWEETENKSKTLLDLVQKL